MNAKATDRDGYEAAFSKLNGVPIVGTHTIGALTIECSMRHWSITDGSNRFGGGALKGEAMRYKVQAALRKWLDLRFGKVAKEKKSHA